MQRAIRVHLLIAFLVLAAACSGHAVVDKTVPAGTPVTLEIVDGVSSAGAHPGDAVTARVVGDIVLDGAPVVPAGSTVTGRVAQARGLKKIGGRALLALEFTAVETPTGTAPIQAVWSRLGKSETKKDAAIIGGSAAGGALLGRVIDGNHDAKGTILGGIVGGAAGTAIAAGTKGQEIVLPSGSQLIVHLQAPTTVKVPA
jgi:hypothetical protein